MTEDFGQMWIDAEIPESGGNRLVPGKHEALITEAGLVENQYGKSLFYKLHFAAFNTERTKFSSLEGKDKEAARKNMGRAKRELKTLGLENALQAKSAEELNDTVSRNVPGLKVLVDVVAKPSGSKGHYFNFMKVVGRDRLMTEANAVFGGFAEDTDDGTLLID